MVGNRQWSSVSLAQAIEIARGELPREFLSWDEVPGSLGESARQLLPSPQAYETDPSDELVEEIRENMDDPHKRLYLPGRKWHSQRTLARIAPALLPTPTGDDANNVTRESGEFQSLAREAHKLLPTPVVADAEGGRTSKGADRPDEVGLSKTVKLLPTPMTDPDSANGRARNLGRETKLLPTPVVTDSYGSRRSTARTEDWQSNPGTTLTDAIWETQEREEDTMGNRLPGASTKEPSDSGKESSGEQPPRQLTIEDV